MDSEKQRYLIARDWYNSPTTTKKEKVLLEAMYPELKESDGEKIRKFLVEYFSGFSVWRGDWDIKPVMILDWLEKQKEQKPAEWSEKDILTLDSIISIVEDWESEQSEEEKEYYGATQKSDFLKSLPERFNLQPKQEWSEEDEKIVRFYEADYHNQIGDMSMKDVINMRLEFKNWLVNRLKSLRPVKQEWSEEDEDKIAIYLHDNSDSMLWSTAERLAKGLTEKLFRPQPHWKPSEEQILAIVEALKYIPNNKEEWIILESLMDDLKKL